jgi:hypothetical protein
VTHGAGARRHATKFQTPTDLYGKVLAAVIVHEATHLTGGSEAAAREAELRFFGALVATGLVSREDGLRYLALLRQRP